MGDIELEPRYSTRELPGKCIKCLAEQEYGNCMRELLETTTGCEEIKERYEALVAFLKSPELEKLRDEAEFLLSQGKEVRVVLHLEAEGPTYEIRMD